MTKFIKLLIGLLVLPLCTAATLCAWHLTSEAATQDLGTMTAQEWALPIGFIIWFVIYMLFPKPWRTYVLAHELTHALWGLLMGARVGKMKVKRDGGSVELSKTNFVITLAPYFFPLYTVIVILAYLGLGLVIDLSSVRWLGLGLVGFTWSFHLTFTIAMLSQHQSDVHYNGRIFSYSIVYLFNVLGICCWITAVGAPTWNDLITQLMDFSAAWYEVTWDFLISLPERVNRGIQSVRLLINPAGN
jgi:hypothetical protein